MNREKGIIKTSIVGIIGNVILVIAKSIVGFIALSSSIILDALNNLTDALNSIITIIGTKLSNKRPDKKHPYGHGRIEYVTSSIIGVVIMFAGLMAIYRSVMALLSNEKPDYSIYTAIIVIIAIVGKIILGIYFKLQGKKYNSDNLKSCGIDALWDSVLSFATLVAIITAHFFGLYIEGYVGIIIGLFIIKASIDIFRESISKIIGERVDPEFRDKILNDINKYDDVLGCYDLIINNYGTDRYIASVHIEIRNDLTARDIQLLERDISTMCFEKYNTIMTVGVYAQNQNSELEIQIKDTIRAVISNYKDILQFHGFFVDEDKKIIGFDIIIDFNASNPNEIYKNIKEEVQEIYKDFKIQIVLDNDISLT